jgi:hypothetical protein
MATQSTSHADKTLDQLLEELTDAKLEKREADIAQLQDEIGKRQARGEPASAPRPDDNAAKAL